MKALSIAAVLFVAVLAVNAAVYQEHEYKEMFSRFMSQYKKKYSADQLVHRYNVFKANTDKIVLANAQRHSYTLGMNDMGDMTHEEFKATKLGFKTLTDAASKYAGVTSKKTKAKSSGGVASSCPAPHTKQASVDWVAAGAINGIGNQFQCASDWAFSAADSVTSDVFIEASEKQLLVLSKQQIMDCSTNSMGCQGGTQEMAFDWIISNGGLTSEADYPYSGTGPNTCITTNPLVAGITGVCEVVPMNEQLLMDAVAQQPVAVAVEADQAVWQFYQDGVLSDPSCGTLVDHAVTAVGFSVWEGQKYWNVKNSWGTSWGLNGYIWLGRQVPGQPDGVCGITLNSTFPIGGHLIH